MVFSGTKWEEDQQKFGTNLSDLAKKAIVVLGQFLKCVEGEILFQDIK